MDNPFESPAVISICPGILGLERGLERAIGRFRTIAYVEIEAFIIENLVCQMEQGLLAPAPIWSDLKAFPFQMFRNKVYGFIGGYPCQPFSIAGNQFGTQDPRHLWPHIKAGIQAARPLWCYFENVANHINLGYEQVRADLCSLGYRVEEGIYSAEEVGAPHVRKRLFILALDNSMRRRYRGQKKEVCSRRIGFELSNKEIGNTNCQGLQVAISGELTSIYKPNGPPERRKPGRAITKDVFPMSQGEKQYEWEKSRVVESGLGCTINGYNFREDLLRALGNSVVEQTAELAFNDLMRKHFSHD